MSKGVPIEIPTHPHIKKYIEKNFGEIVPNNKTSTLNNLLKLCAEHESRRDEDKVAKYSTTLTVFTTVEKYKRHGGFVNMSRAHIFNTTAESIMKHLMITHIDSYIKLVPDCKIKDAIYYAYEQMQIDEFDWHFDTIKKMYYREQKKRAS